MTKFTLSFLTVMFAVSAFCAPAKVSFTPEGFINIDKLGFALVWIDRKWKQSPASSAKNDVVWKLVKRTDNLLIYIERVLPLRYLYTSPDTAKILFFTLLLSKSPPHDAYQL